MKKTIATIAAVALVAMTGLFAQPAKGKKADAKPVPPAPEFKAPPKMELPAEADVKAYHDAELQSYKILLDAQVKAKMVTQEWADAKMAILKAVQKDCKGWCMIRKSTDIPFGAPAFGGPGFGGPGMGGRHFGPAPFGCDGPGFHKRGHKRHEYSNDFKGRPHPRFDPNFNETPDTTSNPNER